MYRQNKDPNMLRMIRMSVTNHGIRCVFTDDPNKFFHAIPGSSPAKPRNGKIDVNVICFPCQYETKVVRAMLHKLPLQFSNQKFKSTWVKVYRSPKFRLRAAETTVKKAVAIGAKAGNTVRYNHLAIGVQWNRARGRSVADKVVETWIF